MDIKPVHVVGCLILPLVVVAFLGIAGAVFWYVSGAEPETTTSGPGSTSTSALDPRHWSGKAPLACDGNDRITVRNASANLPGATAVRAGGRCQLTLIDSSITAKVGIAASGESIVAMRGGSVTADHVVDASGHSHVVFEGVELDGRRRSSPGSRVQEKRAR